MTLKTTAAQVVETSVTVDNNRPIQNYIHPDDHTQPTNEMTLGCKPFTVPEVFVKVSLAQFPSVSLRRTHFKRQGPTLGIRFTEVSVKRESTLYPNFCDVSDTFARFNTQ